jgi:hypothetical protein
VARPRLCEVRGFAYSLYCPRSVLCRCWFARLPLTVIFFLPFSATRYVNDLRELAEFLAALRLDERDDLPDVLLLDCISQLFAETPAAGGGPARSFAPATAVEQHRLRVLALLKDTQAYLSQSKQRRTVLLLTVSSADDIVLHTTPLLAELFPLILAVDGAEGSIQWWLENGSYSRSRLQCQFRLSANRTHFEPLLWRMIDFKQVAGDDEAALTGDSPSA